MPLICSPKNSRMTFTGTKCPHTDLAFKTAKLHLASAIREYEKALNVTVAAHVDAPDAEVKFGSKYFIHTDNSSGESTLVDLHIIRGEEEICPKQDLDLYLLDSDIVEMGPLVC